MPGPQIARVFFMDQGGSPSSCHHGSSPKVSSLGLKVCWVSLFPDCIFNGQRVGCTGQARAIQALVSCFRPVFSGKHGLDCTPWVRHGTSVVILTFVSHNSTRVPALSRDRSELRVWNGPGSAEHRSARASRCTASGTPAPECICGARGHRRQPATSVLAERIRIHQWNQSAARCGPIGDVVIPTLGSHCCHRPRRRATQ